VGRELRRLLVDPRRLAAAAGGELPLQPQELHYLRRVLRLRPADRFAVVDGCGHLWTAALRGDPQRQAPGAVLEQPLDRPCISAGPPAPLLGLAIAPPRRDAELLLRMVCELGIDRLQWLRAERSVVEAPPRQERQQAVLREALEQCERLWLPACAGPEPAAAWLARQPQDHLRLLATTRCGDAIPLVHLLHRTAASGAAGAGQSDGGPVAVSLAVGPEGGWSSQEQEQALARGWLAVSLGDGILRTSTAAVAAAALLSAWRQAGG
jgi:16S rRNA (uracil1498-N3)-methyltransferase